MRDRLTTRAFALALFLAALWGGNPVAIKAGLADCPPLRLGFWRFVLGGLAVLGVALGRRESFRIPSEERWPLVGLGLLFSSQIALMNLGQDRTSAGHAAVIMSSYPLWTAVFAHFLVPGDRLTRARALGALVAYAGVFAVFRGSTTYGEASNLAGDALLVASSVLLGARQIVLSRSSQAISIAKLLLSQALFGSVSLFLASRAFESAPTRWTERLAVALLYQGVVIAGFAFFFQAWLLKRFPPSRVATVYLSQPLFGVLLSFWILGEPISNELGLGALLVVLGSYFVQRR